MKIGFAAADITPELGIYLTGYGRPERLATGVHSPLKATVMVLQNEEKTAAVLGFDWCYMDTPVVQEIKRGISGASGIAEDNILLCCSHTHSAPHTASNRSLGHVSVDPECKGFAYVMKIIPAVAEAVCQAKASLHEAEAGFAAGKTLCGVSRRGKDDTGRIAAFIGDPELIHDDNMTTVLFRDRETHEELGILVHCSAHNTSMGIDRNISSDWCGVMRNRMEQRYPVPILFLNGAFGDVGPRTNVPIQYPTLHGFAAGGGDGPASAAEVGYRAATDALRLLENMRDFRSDLPLKVSVTKVTMPQEIPMSEEEARRIVAEYEAAHPEKVAEPPTNYQIAQVMLKVWSEPRQPEFEFDQTLVAFGPAALVPFPFEIFSAFSLRLRKYGPFQYTLPCGNANGYNAYLPDRGAVAEGGYEATCRKEICSYVTVPEAGDLAVAQTLKALREMQK